MLIYTRLTGETWISWKTNRFCQQKNMSTVQAYSLLNLCSSNDGTLWNLSYDGSTFEWEISQLIWLVGCLIKCFVLLIAACVCCLCRVKGAKWINSSANTWKYWNWKESETTRFLMFWGKHFESFTINAKIGM